MSVKRTLKVYERLQIAMNPARAFVTHICKTLKNGTGFQATCKNMIHTHTWRIIPVSKWLVTPVYKLFRPFGKGITPVRGLTNHGY